jgi:hypothetical protein
MHREIPSENLVIRIVNPYGSSNKFNMVLVSIEESKFLSQLTDEELMVSLLTHESWFSQIVESLENVF